MLLYALSPGYSRFFNVCCTKSYDEILKSRNGPGDKATSDYNIITGIGIGNRELEWDIG